MPRGLRPGFWNLSRPARRTAELERRRRLREHSPRLDRAQDGGERARSSSSAWNIAIRLGLASLAGPRMLWPRFPDRSPIVVRGVEPEFFLTKSENMTT